MTIQAEVAKLIRKDLKNNYPRSKFSVTSDCYSGCYTTFNINIKSNINIKENNDNINITELRSLIDKYQAINYFNALTDSTVYKSNYDYNTTVSNISISRG